MEEDDELGKPRRVLEIFRDRFKSTTVQKHHQTYLNHLYEILNQWNSETNEKIKQFIKDKIEEIDQLYEQYCEQINDKYNDIKEQIENDDSSSDINDQIENFDIYCQLNTIENCIRLQTKLFSNDQLNDNIQLEYIINSDSLSGRTLEPLESPIEERPIESLESPIHEREIEPKEHRTVDPLESSVEEETVEPSESIIQKRTVESPVEEPPESFIKRRLIKSVRSPAKERTIERLESPVQERETEKQTIETSAEIIKKRTIGPLKVYTSDGSESIHSARTSSRGSPVPVQDNSKQTAYRDRSIVRRQIDPSKEEPVIYHPKSSVQITSDDEPKSITRLYVGQRDILTPVLVGKDREVYNESEKITEYSIDSIPVSEEKQEQEANPESEDEMKIVRAYRVLIEEESEYQRNSILSSDQEEKDEDDDEELSNINNKFNLKTFDQINYSTIMFRKCETEYNCMSSSTRRNELLLFNSKLKVLIILQHENHQPCRHRFYLHWPKTLSSKISDITYCQHNDHFLISTRDTNRIYLFDRDLLSLIDLGQLSNDSPLRRIHCYQQTIYCIVANNYLLEYQIDEDYSQLEIRKKIKLFNPIDQTQDTPYYLLDITCDEIYLIIIYSNEHDEIHLQSIYRQTKKFHQDILLDTRQPINQNYIRIESTYINGNFLYLNGSQHRLKAIDLVNYHKGKITSSIPRHTKPTNISFLSDRRLVILYEQPYFLSVHDWNDRQEEN
jgi:hypothetical protein